MDPPQTPAPPSAQAIPDATYRKRITQKQVIKIDTMRALFCTLVLTAALSQAADWSGHYYLQNLREVGSELLLRPNGTFEWVLAYGAADYSAKGTWKAQGDSVILSSPTTTAAPFKLITSSATKTPAIVVHLQGANGRPVPNIDIELATDKGPLKARTDSSGDAEFPKTSPAKTATFDIRVYEFRSEPMKLNPAHNQFNFEINGEAITQIIFKDERLDSKGGALFMHHWPDREMRYTKEQ
jgi:hypothetical protein